MSFALSLLLVGQLASGDLHLPTGAPRPEQIQYRTERDGNLTGTGGNEGRGYYVRNENDGRITNYSGTGRNFGRGYYADHSAGRYTDYSGTGENTGRGYRVRDGVADGTGQNSGGGWVRNPDGTWYGTGSNSGRKCEAGDSPISC
ncbi:MAG: hypothetical protein J0H01_32530 [Rhizobiales bacterium]|nr:hypothetical protein [Hyphomicrobiales bacterium]